MTYSKPGGHGDGLTASKPLVVVPFHTPAFVLARCQVPCTSRCDFCYGDRAELLLRLVLVVPISDCNGWTMP